MRTATVLLIAVLGPCLIACGPDAGAGAAFTVRDSASVEIVENGASTAVPSCALAAVPRIDIGSAAGDEAQQLYRVFDATRLSDGRLAIVNQGSGGVRVFDDSGAFLHEFGRVGGGPGEFRDVFQIWRLPGDTLVVGDYRPWRFSVFTAEGEYIRSVEPKPLYANPPSAMIVLDDGTSVLADDCCFDPSPGFHEQHLHAVRHAPTGERLDTIGVWPFGRWGEVGNDQVQLISYPIFEPTARVAGGGDRIVAGHAAEPRLEVYDREGRLIRIIRWLEDDRAVRPEDVAAFRRARLERATTPRARQFAEAATGDHVPVNDRFPAFSDVVLSAEGEVWVKRYRRPLDQGPDRWLVFQPDGGLRCRAETPEGLAVFEVGRNYVLGRQADELEVEHVLLFERTGS